MTALFVIGGILLLVLTHQVTKFLVIEWRRAGHCKHEDVVRYWFKNHRYAVWCRRCASFPWSGRDPTHGPYPKAREGVERRAS